MPAVAGTPQTAVAPGMKQPGKTASRYSGVDKLPAGVKACSMKGQSGYTGGGACHIHDGTSAGMKAAMAKASSDVGSKAYEGDLETVDLEGIPVMAAGGPYKGVGSPPEGDSYTSEDLARFVDAASDLADAGLKPPAKIGHEATAPRVGWLDKIRLSDDKQSILADIRDVPKQFAQLVKAGAYRARSPEFYKITSQKTGKSYDEAIGALAWLGARRPAIQKLSDFNVDEVFALYEDMDAEFVRAFEFDEPEASTDKLFEALADLTTSNLELARQVADGKSRAAADTRAMTGKADDRQYTDEQVKAFADATGLDTDKVTDEVLAAAGVAATETAPKVDDTKPEEPSKALEARLETIEKMNEQLAKRAFEAECSSVLHSALVDGRLTPGEKPAWETRYLAAYEAGDTKPVVDALNSLPKNETLAREFGQDEQGENKDEETRLFEAHETELASRLGIPKELVL